MKDFLGNNIEVSDNVIFMQKNYRNFLIGKIIHMSKKKIKIEHNSTNTCSRSTIQFGNQVIKDPQHYY